MGGSSNGDGELGGRCMVFKDEGWKHGKNKNTILVDDDIVRQGINGYSRGEKKYPIARG